MRTFILLVCFLIHLQLCDPKSLPLQSLLSDDQLDLSKIVVNIFTYSPDTVKIDFLNTKDMETSDYYKYER